jgi:hypothetical protein
MYSIYNKYKKKRNLKKLDKIDEDKIYVEKKDDKYNELNQINLWKKIYEIYLEVVKQIFNNHRK